MNRVALLGPVLLCLATLGAAAAAEEEKEKLDWSLSGEVRFRPEWRDDADLDSAVDDDLRQGFSRLRLGLSLQVSDPFRLFFQAQDSRVAGDEASTTSNEKNLDLHQGYLEIRPASAAWLSLVIGRQEIKYGDERLIGALGWDNVGRSFDGLKGRYTRNPFWLDVLAARTTNRTVNGSTTGSSLYGVYTQAAPRQGSEYEGYLLSFDDQVTADGETGAPGDTLVNAIGGRARDRFGRFDYVAEAAVQRGRFRGDDLSAWAAAAQTGLTWGDGWKVRTFLGYDFATGDEDPVDGEREEFFNFFPTNHLHYGYMDYEGWRNIRSPWVGVSSAHGRHWSQLKAHRFLLEEEAGAWKDAAGNVLGFDPTGSSGDSVGSEVDLTYRFSIQERTALEGGISRFTPGRFARLTRGADSSEWAYVMFTLGF